MPRDYQDWKLLWLSVLPLTKDAIHIYVGFLAFLGALLLLRLRITSYFALLPGLVISLAMEVFDLRDGFELAESVKDLVNTNLIPFLLVQIARWRLIKS
jgi:uncharacterized membrane protein (DUF2068 family)